jgi:long-chain acyl-CoA synthetase
MLRTQCYGDPKGRFLHELILESCRRFPNKTAIVDTSCTRCITYAEYGKIVESLARGLTSAGLQPGEVVAIFLYNCWEFCAAYHATTLAGGVPTPVNPTYREREVKYQLENSGAVFLITDAANINGINLSALAHLRRVYTVRQTASGAELFSSLLRGNTTHPASPEKSSEETLAALPYSSGTTGLPKGVMLSHFNLVANLFQVLAPHGTPFSPDDVILCFLPLYHIYGLNVVLNPVLTIGATLVLMPRFQVPHLMSLLIEENVTMMPLVPPALNALCQAAEQGQFPKNHRVHWVKSGAAPLSPELPRRFTALTGIQVMQGYGMTEASPVTHLGFLEPGLYKPESVGKPVAQTECRVLDTDANDVPSGSAGELVMRGPQFMLGYWQEPAATAAVLRDGWYWSGDIVTKDMNDFYYVVDRVKEMIKYKGFPIAPAEIEAVLLEHPAVRECGVVGRPDSIAGEIPVAFISLRDGFSPCNKVGEEICAFVADRLTHYKQPREVRFVDAVPKTASGKILRRELKKALN